MVRRVPRRLKRGYCQRTGDRVHVSQLTIEPGTGLQVSKKASDGIYNRSQYDPRNYPARANPNEGKPRPYDDPNPYPDFYNDFNGIPEDDDE
ncbi:MAG: hypothetical protein HRT61_01395 [Ekhidna sp.]|nr:hypothetical protein [Ekhidna sp.]